MEKARLKTLRKDEVNYERRLVSTIESFAVVKRKEMIGLKQGFDTNILYCL